MSEYEYAPTFGYPVCEWFRSFAWRPIQTSDRGYVWLRPVWKRRIAKKPFLNGGPDFWFQYVVTK